MFSKRLIILALIVCLLGLAVAKTQISDLFIKVSKLYDSGGNLVMDLDNSSLSINSITAKSVAGGLGNPSRVIISKEGATTVARWFNGSVICSGTDDATVINNAINTSLFWFCNSYYCGLYGGLVHISPGVYTLTKSIKVPGSVWGLVLEGEGPGTIIQAPAGINAIEAGEYFGSPETLRANYGRDIQVKDMSLQGDKANWNKSSTDHIGVVVNADGALLDGLIIRWFKTGIRLNSGGEIRVSRSTLQYNKRGIEIFTNDAQMTEDIISLSEEEGLYINSLGGLLADKCHIWGNKVALAIYNSWQNWFSHCEMEDNSRQAVIIYASYNKSSVLNKFDNCMFWHDNKENASTAFIELMAESGGYVINNLFQNCVFYNDASTQNTYPIYQWQGNGTIVEGCHYYGFGKTPVYS